MDKTKALITSQKLIETIRNITLSINNFPIQILAPNSFKYLGVTLDNKLSFKEYTAWKIKLLVQ